MSVYHFKDSVLAVILYLILFQKMVAPGIEESDRSCPGTPNGDVMTPSEEAKERQEYLEVNFKYPFLWIIGLFEFVVSQ